MIYLMDISMFNVSITDKRLRLMVEAYKYYLFAIAIIKRDGSLVILSLVKFVWDDVNCK